MQGDDEEDSSPSLEDLTSEIMDAPGLKQRVGKFVLDARLARGLTQKELAALAGVQEHAILRCEGGKSIPHSLSVIAERLGTKIPPDLAADIAKQKRKNSPIGMKRASERPKADTASRVARDMGKITGAQVPVFAVADREAEEMRSKLIRAIIGLGVPEKSWPAIQKEINDLDVPHEADTVWWAVNFHRIIAKHTR